MCFTICFKIVISIISSTFFYILLCTILQCSFLQLTRSHVVEDIRELGFYDLGYSCQNIFKGKNSRCRLQCTHVRLLFLLKTPLLRHALPLKPLAIQKVHYDPFRSWLNHFLHVTPVLYFAYSLSLSSDYLFFMADSSMSYVEELGFIAISIDRFPKR